jgi:hypothetical protein
VLAGWLGEAQSQPKLAFKVDKIPNPEITNSKKITTGKGTVAATSAKTHRFAAATSSSKASFSL